jgi:hypothetical protein
VPSLSLSPQSCELPFLLDAEPSLDFVATLDRTDEKDGKKVELAGTDVEWTLTEPSGTYAFAAGAPGLLGIVNVLGMYTAPPRPPVDRPPAPAPPGGPAPPLLPGTAYPEVRIEASYTDPGGVKYRAQSNVKLKLVWPDSWPFLADPSGAISGSIGWTDNVPALGERVGLILYDILAQMPPNWLQRVEQVAILRGTAFPASFHSPIPSAFVLQAEGHWQRTVDAGFPGGGPPADDERVTGANLVHELSHAVMTYECGGGFVLVKAVVDALESIVRVGAKTVTVERRIVVVPYLPWALMSLVVGAVWGKPWYEDFMADWADSMGWKMNNVAAGSIPLLGLVLPWITTAPPNVITAFRGKPIGDFLGGSPWINTRHDGIDAAKTTYKVTDSSPETDWDKVVAEVDGVSHYALTDPHEDWAESLLTLTFGEAELTRLESLTFRPVNASRRKFIKEHDIWPATWPRVEFGKVLGEYGKWDVAWENHAAKVEPDRFRQMLAAILEGPAAVWGAVGRLMEIIRAIETQPPHPGPDPPVPRDPMAEPSHMEFLRLAETHGDGMLRYSGEDHEAEPGDTLVARDDYLWIVTQVDEHARVAQAMGAAEVTVETDFENLRLDREEVRYHWRPASEYRRFSEPAAQRSGAYADLEGTLHALVGWWGRTERPAATSRGKPRPVNGVGSFFAEALDAAGIVPDDLPLPEEPVLRDVKAFCETHGDGLRPWEPGQAGVAVGDWVGFFDENVVGVVTRTREGLPVDVCVGGEIPVAARGSYRDAADGGERDAVRMLHSVDQTDVLWLWRPSAHTRQFGGGMGDVWQDLDRGLNNALLHVGLDSVTRGGVVVAVVSDPFLTQFSRSRRRRPRRARRGRACGGTRATTARSGATSTRTASPAGAARWLPVRSSCGGAVTGTRAAWLSRPAAASRPSSPAATTPSGSSTRRWRRRTSWRRGCRRRTCAVTKAGWRSSTEARPSCTRSSSA